MTPDVIPALQVFAGPPPVLDGVRLLAEGDSWFTLGALNLAATNLLLELRLERRTTVLSCAYPGDTLQHMVDGTHDPHFDRLLQDPRFAWVFFQVTADNQFNGIVNVIEPSSTGASVYLSTTDEKAQDFTATFRTRIPSAYLGREIPLAVNLEKAHFFDAETEQSILLE